MINKIYVVENYDEVLEGEKLNLPVKEQLIENTFWFKKDDIQRAYINYQNFITIQMEDGDLYRISNNEENREFLNKLFNDK